MHHGDSDEAAYAPSGKLRIPLAARNIHSVSAGALELVDHPQRAITSAEYV